MGEFRKYTNEGWKLRWKNEQMGEVGNQNGGLMKMGYELSAFFFGITVASIVFFILNNYGKRCPKCWAKELNWSPHSPIKKSRN